MCEIMILKKGEFYHLAGLADTINSFENLIILLKKRKRYSIYLWTIEKGDGYLDFFYSCNSKGIKFKDINGNLMDIQDADQKKKIIFELNKLSLEDWSTIFGFIVIV